MTVDLFDAQVGILGAKPGARDIVTPDDLLAVMDRFGIGRALVRIAPPDLETDVVLSNSKLYEACARDGRLVPCPVVVPNTAGDLPSEGEQVADAIARGAGAVWARFEADGWLPAAWISDRIFSALAERRIPVFVTAPMLPPPRLAEIADRFPDLPLIYAEVGYRDQRVLLALLERFSSVHLSIGYNYRVQGGIEQLTERVGARRLLFGTGFAQSEPMGTVMQLLCADLSEQQKRQIGCENLQHLMGGIRR
ncbi:MAG TPA: amidohydrolase family protein [Phycisphaerae bacterium]|nr:amidohydrolase family protein [Phycisphaerae bacterium]